MQRPRFNKLLLLFTFLIFTIKLNSLHIIGGEITYRCLGGDRYEMELRVYRDCDTGGANFDSTDEALEGTVTIYNGQNLFIRTISLDAPIISDIEPDLDNPCLLIPANVCVQQGIYKFIVDLPNSPESYHISYQRCCRNPTIANISTPGDQGATYTMEITPTSQDSCNSSPIFNDFPPIVICSGEPFNFDHSATDPDGDSLAYKTFIPFHGGGKEGLDGGDFQDSRNGLAPNPELPPPYQRVSFINGFNQDFPFSTNPIFNLDENTGELTFTPTVNGQYVVGILVEEYRNGELLSVVRRDFQFNVTTCEPLVRADIEKDLSAQVDASVVSINSCGINTIPFINQSVERRNIVEHYWEFDLKSDGVQEFTSWDVTVTFPDTGRYDGRLVINPGLSCGDTAEIDVNIFPGLEAGFDFENEICEVVSIDFTDTSTVDDPRGVQQYQWSFGDGLTSNLPNPSIDYTSPGTKPINLKITDANGCMDEANASFDYFPIDPTLIPTFSKIDSCSPVSIVFEGLDDFYTDEYTFNWNFDDGNTSNEIMPTYVYESPGLYTPTVNIVSKTNCQQNINLSNEVKVIANAIASFNTSNTEVSNINPFSTFTNTSQFENGIEWSIYDETFFSEMVTYEFIDTGLTTIQLIAFHDSGCSDTAFIDLTVQPEVRIFYPNAFVPNETSLNNNFRPTGFFEYMTEYKLTIFNRWGQSIFETTDPDEGWNGRFHNEGDLLPLGVYIYVAEYVDAFDKPFKVTGYATLIK